MAKSFTKRKSRTKAKPEQIAQIEESVFRAVEYVKEWKRREIFNMAFNPKKGELPVCVPIKKDAYLVGQHGIKRVGRIWELTDATSERVLYFTSKSTAIVYSVCYQTRYLKLAQDLKTQDYEVLQLTEDIEQMNYSIARARRKKDWWRVDHFTNLISHAEARLQEARDRLEKTINLAKYFKIWE